MRKWIMRTAIGLVAVGFSSSLVGCGGGDDPPKEFRINFCSHKGLTDAPVNAPIYVEFNDALAPATVDQKSVVLQQTGKDPFPCILTFVGGDLTIEPPNPLEYAAEYTLTLNTTLEGLRRGPLPEPEEFTFTTQAQPLPIEVPPFDVVRHGVTMNGLWANAEGALAVGDGTLILLSTDEGRFVLPTPPPYEGFKDWATDVWVSDLNVAYLTQVMETQGIEVGVMWRIENRLLEYDDDGNVNAHSVHGASSADVVAVGNDGVWRRWMGARHREWDDVMSPPPGGQGLLDPSISDVWMHSVDIVHVAGVLGIHRGALDLGRLRPMYSWELVRVTTSPWTAISGLTNTDVVGISLANTTWLHGNNADMVRREGFHWTDIWWADENWAVQVGFDTDSAYSVLFDDPLVDHDGRNRRIQTKERLNAVAAWTVSADKYAMTVGEAGVEFKLADLVNDVNDGFWSEETLPKRDALGEIPDWTDLSLSPEVLDSALYGLRGGDVVKCSTSVPGFPGTVLPPPGDLVPHQLYCSGEDDIWITGIADGGIDWFVSHYDGQSWTAQWMSSMDVPRDIWVADAQNVFVACDNGVVFRMGGIQTFMPAVFPPQHLYGVWGSSAKSVWVCGAKGTIAHAEQIGPSAWNWTQVPLDTVTNARLNAIDGSSEDNIVVVGDNGTVLHYDGAWTLLTLPAELELADVDLTMVAALHPDDIWVASPDGIVLRWDGNNWIKWTTGMPSRHNALWGRDGLDGDVWLAGEDDLLLRHADPPAVLPLIENK